MSYELEFLPTALKQWNKLDNSVKSIFKKKLKERLENPKVESAKLSGFENVYKIKLRNLGYRLAYQVIDKKLILLVLVIGKRENNEVYKILKEIKI